MVVKVMKLLDDKDYHLKSLKRLYARATPRILS